MFSFLWGGGGKSQDPDLDDGEESDTTGVDDVQDHPVYPPSNPPPSRAPQRSRQSPPTSHHPPPHSSSANPPSNSSHSDELSAEEFYQQQNQQNAHYYDDEQQRSYDSHQSYDPSSPLPTEDEEVDSSQFDLSMIPLLRATLTRKDEQLIALEEAHDRDIQLLRAKYAAALASSSPNSTSAPSSNLPTPHGRTTSSPSSSTTDVALIHSHPDYLSLHEQYSRLFDEYNAIQDAYAAMERGQGELMGSLREEIEYEVRASMQVQFEEMRRGMEAEREEERRRWREEEEGWRRLQEKLQVQLNTNGPHRTSHDSREEEDPQLQRTLQLLQEKEEEIVRLKAHIQSHTSHIEQERVQMAEEQAAAMEKADQQSEEIERLQAQLQQQQQQQSQPADIQLYSNEEWEQLNAEVERLRKRVSELEQTGAGQGSHDAEYQQHIAALEAHIDHQAQQLQSQANAAAASQSPYNNSAEIEALRAQVLQLTGELAKKDGELQTVHRTVGQKLEQVKSILKKKDAEIARLQQKLAANSQ